MSKFKPINARIVVECEYLDIGVDESRADDETEADDDTSNNNNAGAFSPPDRDLDDIDSTNNDPFDSEGYRSSLATPDTDPVTDETADTITAGAPMGNDHSSASVIPIDSRCEAVSGCVAESCDHRKTVSHIFGRNKAETRRIPDNNWIKWCRKHYQRKTYRDKSDKSRGDKWYRNQLRLVRDQLDRFEAQTSIQSWKIALRKKEQEKLDVENAAVAAGLITLRAPSSAISLPPNTGSVAHLAASNATPSPTILAAESTPSPTDTALNSTDLVPRSANTATDATTTSVTSDAADTVSASISNTTSVTPDSSVTDHPDTLSVAPSDANDDDGSDAGVTPPQVWERFLVPYIGTGKTFTEVRTVCDAIERDFNTPTFQARNAKEKVFPGVEFLPIFPDAEVKKVKAKVTKSTAKGTKRKLTDTKAAAPSKRARLVRGAKC